MIPRYTNRIRLISNEDGLTTRYKYRDSQIKSPQPHNNHWWSAFKSKFSVHCISASSTKQVSRKLMSISTWTSLFFTTNVISTLILIYCIQITRPVTLSAYTAGSSTVSASLAQPPSNIALSKSPDSDHFLNSDNNISTIHTKSNLVSSGHDSIISNTEPTPTTTI